jgi:hypothetical protein
MSNVTRVGSSYFPELLTYLFQTFTSPTYRTRHENIKYCIGNLEQVDDSGVSIDKEAAEALC